MHFNFEASLYVIISYKNMEKNMTGKIINEMIKINGQDTKRIDHALKVFGIAKSIAEQEALGPSELQTLEIAAVLHDIGIRHCEQTFGTCSGKMQEQYGPAIAQEIMDKYDIAEETKKRVLFLIAHHHTYTNIEGIDYRILIEADFIVNYAENDFSKNAFTAAYNKYFKTDAGRQLAEQMFDF